MVRYRLDDLGWYQFEWLCQSLLKATMGLGIEAWGGYSDLGRDAYSERSLSLKKEGIELSGPTVFQAKFVEEANASGAKPWGNLRKAVVGELAAISERISKKRIEIPSNFVILTNAPVSAENRNELTKLIADSFPSISPLIWGAGDLSAMLDDAPNIRVSFPQLLSIRDLQELLASVLDRGVVTRSSLAIAKAKELSSVFVPTRSYNRSLNVLNQHNFAVLSGPPEVGKTTIARLVGLAKLGEGWECLECRSPDDVLRLHRFENPQVFIADDAFGTTDFQPEVAHKWASGLDDVIRLLDSRHWLIWTSRPAPLHAALARMHLQGRAENFPKPGEILVDAAKLSRNERALILYRHAKNANLDAAAKSLIKEHAALVVANEHFTPERAHRFVKKELPELVRIGAAENQIKAAITSAIEQPTISMKKSFDSLSREHQFVLTSMLDASSGSVSRKDLLCTIGRHNVGAAKECYIDDLSSHFLRCSEEDWSGMMPWLRPSEPSVGWMHPSWRDLVIDQLSTDAARRREFLSNCALPGFKLALSIAGGATGGRTRPLLLDADDWDALSKSLPAIVAADDWGQFSLLSSIEVALMSEKDRAGHRPSLSELARNVLAMLRDYWKENDSRPLPDSLQAYYKISEFLVPLPPGPLLTDLWEDSFDVAKLEMEEFESWTTSVELEGVKKWLRLAVIIQSNEPRFLRQKCFPAKFEVFVEELLRKMRGRIKSEPDLTTEEECSDEESRLSSIKDIAEEIGNLFEELEETPSEIAECAEAAESSVRGVRYELEDAARKAKDEEKEELVQASPISIPPVTVREIGVLDQQLSIDLLFSDL